MADSSRINPVCRPVPCRYDAAVPEPSAGLPVIPGLPWKSLSHRRVLAELAAEGWVPCGVGDWAVALRSPEGTVVARVCPFDPAYRAFVSCAASAPATDGCRGSSWPPASTAAVRWCSWSSSLRSTIRSPDSSLSSGGPGPAIRSSRRCAGQRRGSTRNTGKSTPWWGRCDLDDAHIFRAADRPVLIDVCCVAGTDLYRAILDDAAGVRRQIPRERMRYALDISYIARENSTGEILALKRPGHAPPGDHALACRGTTAYVRRPGTWHLLFQRAILVVAANTPAYLRVTLARRWR